MAIKTNFINDRILYYGEDLNRQFSSIVGTNGRVDYKADLIVKQAPTPSMDIQITSGACYFNGMYTYSDSLEVLSVVNNNTTLDRIDSVVLEYELGTGFTFFNIVQGLPSVYPTAPELTPLQYKLADVVVKKGTLVITDSDITNVEDSVFMTEDDVNEILSLL